MTRHITVLTLGTVLALASAAPSFAQDQSAQDHARTPRHPAPHTTRTNQVNPTGYYDYDTSGTFGDAYKSGYGKGGFGR